MENRICLKCRREFQPNRGKQKYCNRGCFRASSDLAGRRFGKLLVLCCLDGTVKPSRRRWLCRCDCGKTKSIRAINLTWGGTRSCGCLGGPSRKPDATIRRIYNIYSKGARERGLSFNLTLDEVKSITTLSCWYCGDSPRLYSPEPAKYAPVLYNGIDRIDNSKGYSPGNCVSCCTRCNLMKSDLSIDSFVQHCVKVYLHQSHS